jgi:hypothetical protein
MRIVVLDEEIILASEKRPLPFMLIKLAISIVSRGYMDTRLSQVL